MSTAAIDSLVIEFGQLRSRSESQIAAACELLSTNWINTLEQWQDLDASARRSIGLPVALEEYLSRVCTTVFPPPSSSDSSASSSTPTSSSVSSTACTTGESRAELADLFTRRLSVRSPNNVQFFYYCIEDDEYVFRFNGLVRHRINASAPFSECAKLIASSLGCAAEDIRLFSILHAEEDSQSLDQMDSVVRPFSPSTEPSVFPRLVPSLPIAPSHVWRIDEDSPISRAIQPGRLILAGDAQPIGLLSKFDRIISIDGWLRSLGLGHYFLNFYEAEITEFFAVPWLTREHLRKIVPTDTAAQDRIMDYVEHLRNNGTSGELVSEWIRFLGFPDSSAALQLAAIDLEVLPLISSSRLAQLGVPKDDLALVVFFIRQYRDTSSVEQSYNWLESHGFHYVQVSLEFVRSNLPFYSLPVLIRVFFYEMGIASWPSKYSQLASQIDTISDSPSYQTMALFSLLRDLSLEQYTLSFARRCAGPFLPAFQSLTKKTLHELLEGAPQDVINSAVSSIIDAKTLWIYYLSIDAILKEPTIEKNARLFAEAGLPADNIPFLESLMLFDMGVNIEDRQEISKFLRGFDDKLTEIVFAIYGDEPERAPHAFQRFSRFRSKISGLAAKKKLSLKFAEKQKARDRGGASEPESNEDNPPPACASASVPTLLPTSTTPASTASTPVCASSSTSALSTSPVVETPHTSPTQPSSLNASKNLLAALSAGPNHSHSPSTVDSFSPGFGNWVHVDFMRFLPDRRS